MSFEIVDYSEKSIAVFGDVIKYQNEFLDLKGMLNEKLRYKGAVSTGFIFTKDTFIYKLNILTRWMGDI